jgi:hypothetical protein
LGFVPLSLGAAIALDAILSCFISTS